jgi:hypothetical protein
MTMDEFMRVVFEEGRLPEDATSLEVNFFIPGEGYNRRIPGLTAPADAPPTEPGVPAWPALSGRRWS